MIPTSANRSAPEANPTPASGGQTSGDPTSLVAVYATAGLSVLVTSTRDMVLRFHAFQAFFYVLAALAAHGFLTLFGGPFAMLRPLYDLAALGYFGYLIWQAHQGTPAQVPVIASFARKQAAEPPISNSKTVQ